MPRLPDCAPFCRAPIFDRGDDIRLAGFGRQRLDRNDRHQRIAGHLQSQAPAAEPDNFGYRTYLHIKSVGGCGLIW